jgi:hypothetical protein
VPLLPGVGPRKEMQTVAPLLTAVAKAGSSVSWPSTTVTFGLSLTSVGSLAAFRT